VQRLVVWGGVRQEEECSVVGVEARCMERASHCALAVTVTSGKGGA
jgi:hypothetical protein